MGLLGGLVGGSMLAPMLGTAGAASNLAGGIYSARQNKKMNRENLAFQKSMAQNAHQWEVSDLKSAGLNPILSAGGSGAKASGGSSIGIQNPASGMPDPITSMSQMAQINKTKAETKLINNKSKMTDPFSTFMEWLNKPVQEGVKQTDTVYDKVTDAIRGAPSNARESIKYLKNKFNEKKTWERIKRNSHKKQRMQLPKKMQKYIDRRH